MSDNFEKFVESAESLILDAYAAEVRSRGRAVDPAELTREGWVLELLADAYDAASRAEAGRDRDGPAGPDL